MNKVVADVRLGVFVLLPAVEASLPGFDARRFAAHIFLKCDRPVTCPDTAGTAKVRNPRFGADAGAGENDDLFALANFFGKIAQRHHGSIYRLLRAAKTITVTSLRRSSQAA